MPPQPFLRARRGFTIVEVVVILIIIALMLVIIIPHLFNEMSLRKARRVKTDLVSLNVALKAYATDHGNGPGAPVDYASLRKYLNPNTDVYQRNGMDVFGDSYGPFTVGTPPAVPTHTEMKLSSVAGQEFWSPFQ